MLENMPTHMTLGKWLFLVPGYSIFENKCYVYALVCSDCWMLIGSQITTLDRKAMLIDTGSDRGRFKIYEGKKEVVTKKK